jgi:hypothetical protein
LTRRYGWLRVAFRQALKARQWALGSLRDARVGQSGHTFSGSTFRALAATSASPWLPLGCSLAANCGPALRLRPPPLPGLIWSGGDDRDRAGYLLHAIGPRAVRPCPLPCSKQHFCLVDDRREPPRSVPVAASLAAKQQIATGGIVNAEQVFGDQILAILADTKLANWQYDFGSVAGIPGKARRVTARDWCRAPTGDNWAHTSGRLRTLSDEGFRRALGSADPGPGRQGRRPHSKRPLDVVTWPAHKAQMPGQRLRHHRRRQVGLLG